MAIPLLEYSPSSQNQRVLGRNVYSDREKLAWSIVLATKGLAGFIDALLDSEEYLDNFGNDIVPYQRRRILPQRIVGEAPFARRPRYGADYRSKLEDLGYFAHKEGDYAWSSSKPYLPPAPVLFVAKILTFAGAGLLGLLTLAVAFAAFGWISL
jgi:phycobilisome rod-core linker protein